MFLFVFLLSLGAVLAAPTHILDACDKQINVPTSGYQMPMTNMSEMLNCQFDFIIPSGYYANALVGGQGLTYADYVYVSDKSGDEIILHEHPSQANATYSVQTQDIWPTNFSIRFQSPKSTSLQMQVTITLTPYPQAKSMGTIPLQKNGPSSLVYFNELQEGYSYTFTSPNSVYLQADAAFFNTSRDIFQNVFVYDGDNIAGTLNALHMARQAYISTKLTILCVKSIPLQGAVFVTDYSNVGNLSNHEVNYVPLDYDQQTSYAMVATYTSQADALTVIGNKDGSTPFSIRQINLIDPASAVAALPGGPVADYSLAIKLNPNRVPYHFGGNMNTFYGTGGTTTFKYTITQN